MPKKRRPLFAALLSLLAVGLGQLYNGKPRKALLFVLVSYLGLTTLSIFLLDDINGVVTLIVLAIAFILYMLYDAYRDARIQQHYELKYYNRWYLYLLYWIFLTFVVRSGVSAILKQYCYEAFRFPSVSMSPTLVPGDHLIVKKLWLSKEKVRRGDLILFTLEDAPEVNLLQRAIALPDEYIEIREKVVFINDKPLQEPYAKWLKKEDIEAENFPRIQIPKNALFVLGDNRNRSKDSRFSRSPFIPLERVTGKAIYIYWNWHTEESRAGIRLDESYP